MRAETPLKIIVPQKLIWARLPRVSFSESGMRHHVQGTMMSEQRTHEKGTRGVPGQVWLMFRDNEMAKTACSLSLR